MYQHAIYILYFFLYFVYIPIRTTKATLGDIKPVDKAKKWENVVKKEEYEYSGDNEEGEIALDGLQ